MDIHVVLWKTCTIWCTWVTFWYILFYFKYYVVPTDYNYYNATLLFFLTRCVNILKLENNLGSLEKCENDKIVLQIEVAHVML